jgi:ATP-dependent DNA ligase
LADLQSKCDRVAALREADDRDGEAVACDDNGAASFDLVRHHRANESIFLYAFDLIELNGDDLRRDPLVVRKARKALDPERPIREADMHEPSRHVR